MNYNTQTENTEKQDQVAWPLQCAQTRHVSHFREINMLALYQNRLKFPSERLFTFTTVLQSCYTEMTSLELQKGLKVPSSVKPFIMRANKELEILIVNLGYNDKYTETHKYDQNQKDYLFKFFDIPLKSGV